MYECKIVLLILEIKIIWNIFRVFTQNPILSSYFQTQMGQGLALSSLRLDKLFDYFHVLSDPQARSLVKDTFEYFHEDIQTTLEKRNAQRYREGKLTNQYMEPRWLTNSIHVWIKIADQHHPCMNVGHVTTPIHKLIPMICVSVFLCWISVNRGGGSEGIWFFDVLSNYFKISVRYLSK